jgi:hypothetical protein
LKSDYKLRVGRTLLKSRDGARLPFLGLFACDESKTPRATVFAPKQFIVPYVGEVLTKDELEERYHGDEVGPYAVELGRTARDTSFLDAALVRGAASMSNMCVAELAFKDEDGTPMCKNNARIAPRRGADWFSFLQATDFIKNHDEIYTDYGAAYFQGVGGSSSGSSSSSSSRTLPSELDHETRPVRKYNSTAYKCKTTR